MESVEALKPKTLRYLYITAVLYLAAHIFVCQTSRYNFLSAFMIVGIGLLKIACCVWIVAGLSKAPTRFRWLAIACGTVLSNIAAQIYAWRNIFVSSPSYLSVPASLFTSLACIPILAALTFNFQRREPRSVRWIDLAIGLNLGALFTVLFLFSSHTLSLSSDSIIHSVNRLIDFQQIFLALCSALLFLSADSTEDRRFAYVFFLFIASAIPLLAVRNRMAATHPAVSWDVVLDLPPLIFIFLALSPMPEKARNFYASDKLVYVVRGGTPVLSSVALTLLGIVATRAHFYVGGIGILLGIAGYGLRSAIIQGRLLETENRLVSAKQHLEIQASQDGLTGIANRRLFDQTLEREWRIASRVGLPFALLMMDIDHFKGFNDTYGHQKGDDCLVAVARAIQDHLPRTGDFVARYGGEEFAVILPGASISAALSIGERLRIGVMQLGIPNAASQHPCVSVSVGAAASDMPGISDPASLLNASDKALYLAKNAGKNRVASAVLSELMTSEPDADTVTHEIHGRHQANALIGHSLERNGWDEHG